MKNAVKKALSIMLVAVMLFGTAPLNGFVGLELPDWLNFGKLFAVEAEAATSGYYTYKVSSGKVTITNVNTSISGDITIPSTIGGYPVTRIGNGAFEICYKITSIKIPDSVTQIDGHAFYSCKNLTSVTIPDSVTNIGEYTFGGCGSLTSVVIPDGVTNIGKGTFQNCFNLTNVIIPDSVTNIGDSAFNACISLTSVTIPDSVTSIGSWAFSSCNSLTNITIPDSVTEIGEAPFRGSESLTSITVESTNAAYSSDEYGVLFNKDKTLLIQYPIGNTRTSYDVSDSVKNIGNYAFFGCERLTNITIPDSVTSIGDDAFHWCTGLTSLTIPDGVTNISSMTFYRCESLTNVTIPNSVKSIGDSAFNGCGSLASVTIPNSVTRIGYSAFDGCESLTNVIITNSIISIDEYAFYGCSSLKDIYFDGTEEEWRSISIEQGNDALQNSTIHYKGPIVVNLNAYTTIDGSSIWSKCFGVTISSDDENAPLPENIYSIVDYYGMVTFPIEFTEEDLQGSSSKTFKYILTISSADGKKYDFIPKTHQVEITINNTNGELSQEGLADCYNFNGYSYKSFEFGLTWDDGDDCCGVRPDSLSLNLVSGRTEEKIPFTINMDSRWSAELSVREVTDDFWYHNYYVEGLDYLENIGYTVSLRESDDGYCVDAVASLSYCTVGFYTENGLSPETQYVVRNSYVAEPKAPVSPYYNFIGWYKDKDCTAGKEWDFETDTVTRNTTLYAKWEPKPVKITLKTEYGTLQEGENIKELTITIPAFSAIGIKLSEELYDSNYNHIGWVDEDGNVITATTELCEDTTLYAVWQKKPYSNATVRIKNNPGSKTINYGESIKLTATVTNKPDNARKYWYVDGDFMGMGEVFEFGFSGGTKIITVKLVDSNENVLKDVNGNEISDSENVTVKAGFFQKLIAFFKKLFGISQTVVQSIYF